MKEAVRRASIIVVSLGLLLGGLSWTFIDKAFAQKSAEEQLGQLSDKELKDIMEATKKAVEDEINWIDDCIKNNRCEHEGCPGHSDPSHHCCGIGCIWDDAVDVESAEGNKTARELRKGVLQGALDSIKSALMSLKDSKGKAISLYLEDIRRLKFLKICGPIADLAGAAAGTRPGVLTGLRIIKEIIELGIDLEKIEKGEEPKKTKEEPKKTKMVKLYTPDAVAAGEVMTCSVVDDEGNRIPDVDVALVADGNIIEGVVVETDEQGRKRIKVPEWLPAATIGSLVIVAFNELMDIETGSRLAIKPQQPAAAQPQISSCDKVVVPGKPFRITGNGFSGAAEENIIRIDGQAVPQGHILAASSEELKLVCPKDISAGKHAITIEVNGVESAPFSVNMTKLMLQLPKRVLRPGETIDMEIVAMDLKDTCYVDIRGENVKLIPSGRIKLTDGKAKVRLTGLRPGPFSVEASIVPEPKEFSPETYPAGLPSGDLAQALAEMQLPPDTRAKLTGIINDAIKALGNKDGRNAVKCLQDFRRQVERDKKLTGSQRDFLSFAAATMLQQIYAQGLAKPAKGKGKIIKRTQEFREADLDGDGKPDPELTLVFPQRLGGRTAKGNLVGNFSYEIDTGSGELFITDLNAKVESLPIEIDIDGDGILEQFETGEIELKLTAEGFPKELISKYGEPNRGFYDLKTNAARVTWGIEANCELLRKLGESPILLLLAETGRFNPETQLFSMVGYTTIYKGLLRGMLLANCCLWCDIDICGNRDAKHVDRCDTCRSNPTKANLDACSTCQLSPGHTGNHQCAHGHTW